MNISGAIFDLDGTLLDTTEIWEGVAARYITSLRKTPEPGLREKTKMDGDLDYFINEKLKQKE